MVYGVGRYEIFPFLLSFLLPALACFTRTARRGLHGRIPFSFHGRITEYPS